MKLERERRSKVEKKLAGGGVGGKRKKVLNGIMIRTVASNRQNEELASVIFSPFLLFVVISNALNTLEGN